MKNIIKSLLVVSCYMLVVPSFAETAGDDYTAMQSATIQVMDKAAGRTRTFIVPVGESIKVDKLEILVKKCLGTNEFLPEDFYMFADIVKNDGKIFSGWMTKSEPGQNPLQDPDNDLWLVRCE